MKILGIDSDYDEITSSACSYRREFVYPYLLQHCSILKTCIGYHAQRDIVKLEACVDGLEYITGSGHGLSDVFQGDNRLPIFKVGDYGPEEVDGKIVHLLACNTANDLGVDMVYNGCRAFFGYNKPFAYELDDSFVFWECDAAIDLGFCDGLNADEVYQRVQNLYEERISQYKPERKKAKENHDSDRFSAVSKIIGTLQLNLKYLCAPSVSNRWGDIEASLTRSPGSSD